MSVRVGTAGWSVPKSVASSFGPAGSALQRYACVFDCAEINSTFYRSHRQSTYERWAQSVPDRFAFSVKMPKEITHVRKLVDCGDPLSRFLDETAALGEKRQVVLVQLPPKFAYDAPIAEAFFNELRSMYTGRIAFEPRHPVWFEPQVEQWLGLSGISRVAADPAPVPKAAMPSGSAGMAYFRLHGSPRMYYSAYTGEAIAALAATFAAFPDVWCIFDNTASGAGAADALALLSELNRP